VVAGQTWLLAELAKTTGGAAEALNGPYKDALNESADAVEDAQRALAEGFMPVIAKAATWIKTKLGDKAVIQGLRDLGNSLAGMLDKGLDFATSIPWDKVMTAMRAVGAGAKMALDAFLAMPSWVQTAVVGGWGLNKLTGGALGDIVGALGSGLIKGVLGMNAGVVNINAGVVNGGPGGTPGVPPVVGAAAAAGGAGAVVTAGLVGGMIAIPLASIGAQLANLKPESARTQPAVLGGKGFSVVIPPLRKIESNTAQALGVTRNLRQSTDGVKAAALESARAIRAKKWDVDVKVNVPVRITTKVSIRDITRVVVTSGRYAGKTVPL
jgi:hypothetical protein